MRERAVARELGGAAERAVMNLHALLKRRLRRGGRGDSCRGEVGAESLWRWSG